MLLTGTFARSIDEKQRIAIPKPWRSVFGEVPGGTVYIAPGTDGSLGIYTEAGFNTLAERLAEASPHGQDVRAFRRLFYARAQTVEMDSQGRIRIPPELAKLVSLEKEGMLIGVQDHVELWDAARWQAYLSEKQTHYDEIAEAAFDGRK